MSTERIRELLEPLPSCQEKRMFGSLSFMVNDKILINVRRTGELLVRVDPARLTELLARPGVSRAVMGSRTMTNGWLTVVDEDVDFWVETALEYNDKLS
ncbi:TfoX family protein [Pseudonocardiaceae bacterium YIM PH 21723]|nr:TfoX family protein [Pseudonocardiaceae bacterium YIM PH 21723]